MLIFEQQSELQKQTIEISHSSVDPSATTIMWPWVWISSMTSTLFQIIWLKLLMECENKQKGRDWPLIIQTIETMGRPESL